tara:strand:- start:435 stop:992 length:558 start_codon:yes stop_codon:yes gene_type:complete
MKIHSSHSRKELIQVIEQFNIDITNKNDLAKKDISALLIMKLNEMCDDEIQEEDEYFFVSSKQELIDYLQKPNQSKILTIKEKDNVMETAKKIISYCKNSFFLTPYNYETFDELITEATYIAKFGDIPSVRRAISMLNQDPKLTIKIESVISKRVKKDIDKKNKLKHNAIPKAVVKHGHFVINFD